MTNDKFVHRESFKHKLAKELLYQWLKEREWKHWCGDGIFVEYPLCPRKDDQSNHWAFNYHDGGDDYDYYEKLGFSPSYADCVANGDIPIKVADIAYITKGWIAKIFEVYHTHRIKSSKLKELKELYPQLKIYEVSAESILRLTEKPENILDICERVA